MAHKASILVLSFLLANCLVQSDATRTIPGVVIDATCPSAEGSAHLRGALKKSNMFSMNIVKLQVSFQECYGSYA